MATRVTDRAGQVLGGRYRLVAPIGTGASASVYLAEDTTLRRRVAVKVLHDALADDEAFLRRFQAEAHASAALNHPHVMAVYDWSHGGEGEVAYLVMEYLSGGNLKSLLDGGYRLSLSQALLVGLEAARGLDYAHRRGFVHRDVKPANLLFDEEGRLRIADFGLARALAEAAWTEPMGAVLGTARYASPEQARGERLDGRSDVYSLALVLVECVTGIVPFAADTTLGTLMARVDKPLPVPDELGPLAAVVRAAGVCDPAERIDADALGRGLLRVAEQLDPPRPLPLVHTVPDEVTAPEPDDITAVIGGLGAGAAVIAAGGTAGDVVGASIADTDHEGFVLPTAPIVADDLPPPLSRAERRAAKRSTKDAVTPVEPLEPEVDDAVRADDTALYEPASWAMPGEAGAPTTTVRPSGAVFDYELDSDFDSDLGAGTRRRRARRDETGPSRGTRPPNAKRSRRRVWVAVTIVVVLLAGAAGGGAAWYGWNYHEVTVVVGDPVAEVQAMATENGWVLARSDRYEDGTVAGDVLEQSPAAGKRLARDATLTVVVSLGPAPVAVPTDLAGRPLLEAGAALDAAGLVPGTLARVYDEEVPVDHVISVAPGTPVELPRGSAVDLIVSDGPEPRTIPEGLMGRSQAEVTADLEALGLVVSPVEQFDENVAKGNVFWIDPEPGQQIPKGDTVQIGVSKGPPTVQVPAVRGMSVVEAADALEAAGLVVEGTQGSPRREVEGTNPPAGSTVKKGSSVTIITD